jgi:hypothetical protein
MWNWAFDQLLCLLDCCTHLRKLNHLLLHDREIQKQLRMRSLPTIFMDLSADTTQHYRVCSVSLAAYYLWNSSLLRVSSFLMRRVTLTAIAITCEHWREGIEILRKGGRSYRRYNTCTVPHCLPRSRTRSRRHDATSFTVTNHSTGFETCSTLSFSVGYEVLLGETII